MSKVDFLPEDYVDRKAQQRTNILCLSLFFVVMSVLAATLAITEKRQRNMNLREERVRDKFVQAGESLKQVQLLEQKKRQMMQKAQVSASLMETVPRSLLLATVTNNLPSGVSLVAYDLKTKIAKQTVSTSRLIRSRNKRQARSQGTQAAESSNIPVPEKVNTSIEIEGLAGSDIQVARFIANLNVSVLFEQVNLIFSEEYDYEGEALRRFKIMIVLDPDAKASKEDVAMAKKIHVSGM